MSLPPLDVPELLRRYGLRPDKSLGQNFLVDPAALEQVVNAAEINPESEILEIGPGLGNLTRLLAAQARRVVAVELEGRLLEPLRDVLKDAPNVEIIQGDILALNPAMLMRTPGNASLHSNAPYVAVANIPYYITSAVIRHLLEASLQPDRMTLTVQREVADRICAAPGDLSLLALSVQVYGAPRIAAHVSARSFYPAPRIDSAVVRVDIYPTPAIPTDQLPAFFRLAKAGFRQKRKNLRNSISAGMALKPIEAENLLQRAGIDPRRRAETISIIEWQRLTEEWIELSPNPQESAG